ncbi:hypothetical protein E7T09_20430 [Deinococcus sp. KSM4-11]|uniref:hypothetical protein n=1 Tax=Deinococcus sp. KSM4-11 TaxID=2568654 RepID=UPI0010A4FFC8|nr:hypothetical protein [Deinococcus sp. KSM4-11]THF84374.1 hypothetical protein E7T09_20430 [Deinococcus sp. KSM4-11]
MDTAWGRWFGWGRSSAGFAASPVTVSLRECSTLITYWFDSTECHRTSYSFEEALVDAAQYIAEGTPIRKTNRTGPMVSRLVEGIGACHMTFQVDIDPHALLDPEPTPPALAQLDTARARLQTAQYAGSRA